MEYLKKIDEEIRNSEPGYTFIMSVIVGILFSGISFGLIYVIMFIVLWEFFYFLYLDCNNIVYSGEDRLLFALGSIMGFLLGRLMHDDDDHYKEYKKFCRDYDKCGDACGWF
jgi:hypothetical protein